MLVGVPRLVGDGEPELLRGSENILLANGLGLNKQGDLCVSDSVLGVVWRILSGGASAVNGVGAYLTAAVGVVLDIVAGSTMPLRSTG